MARGGQQANIDGATGCTDWEEPILHPSKPSDFVRKKSECVSGIQRIANVHYKLLGEDLPASRARKGVRWGGQGVPSSCDPASLHLGDVNTEGGASEEIYHNAVVDCQLCSSLEVPGVEENEDLHAFPFKAYPHPHAHLQPPPMRPGLAVFVFCFCCCSHLPVGLVQIPIS